MPKEGQIKRFVKAKTPDGLEVLQLEISMRLKAFVPFDVMFAEGFWYAWYLDEADETLLAKVANRGGPQPGEIRPN